VAARVATAEARAAPRHDAVSRNMAKGGGICPCVADPTLHSRNPITRSYTSTSISHTVNGLPVVEVALASLMPTCHPTVASLSQSYVLVGP
jgi:hypothetical protein